MVNVYHSTVSSSKSSRPRAPPHSKSLTAPRRSSSPPRRLPASTLQTEKLSNSSCFSEGGEGAVLLNSLKPLDRDVHNDGLAELGNIDAAPLEVGLATYLASRVILRRAGAVRIPPADLRALTGDFALSRHSHRMVAGSTSYDSCRLSLPRRLFCFYHRARSGARLRRELARRPNR